MQGKWCHRRRMWGVEVEMQVSLNVEVAIHNLETLLVAKISTMECLQNINSGKCPVTHSHCCTTFRMFIIASQKLQRHKICHYTPPSISLIIFISRQPYPKYHVLSSSFV
jgi:hypothetical protein